jgi:anti-sigma regulatory factor (Ser/Thr protein kinase)
MAREPARGLEAVTFAPVAASPSAARRFASDLVERWGLGSLSVDVALCVSELAANALLHAREPFTVIVRPAGGGVRVDVIDPRPDQLPVVVPLVGTVVDLTERSTTGRGMQIVATLADRWGVSTTNTAKAVWVELSGHAHEGPSAPTIVLGHDEAPRTGNLLCYLGLPVRAAVASGIQTDEAVREVQLAELDRPTTGTPEARLLALLDVSAPVRLAGRYAALRAAADGQRRFDLEVTATDESLAAVGELAERLALVTDIAPEPDVLAFRAWLAEETLRQRAGEDPRSCPLPA